MVLEIKIELVLCKKVLTPCDIIFLALKVICFPKYNQRCSDLKGKVVGCLYIDPANQYFSIFT